MNDQVRQESPQAGNVSPLCTVVICTRNRPEALRNCIAELARQSFLSYEILVVENNRVVTEAQSIAASFGARYLLCTHLGLSAARNAGFHASRTEFVAYLDDDATADPDWLQNLLEVFTDPNVMAAAGQIVYEPAKGEREASRPSQVIVNRTTPDWFAQTNFGGIGDGANMAFRRCALKFWTGFDERLGRGAPICESEEHKAFFSVVEKGYSVAYTPLAVVRHPAIPPNLDDRLRPITMSTAFFTLTMVENPKHLLSSLRFILDAFSHRRRSWSGRETKLFDVSVPRWRVYLAMLAGPLVYVRMCIRHPFRQHYGQDRQYEVREAPKSGSRAPQGQTTI